MLISQLFSKTTREQPKDEVSKNAQLLERGGFVYKNSAGIYTFLPLGWRVIEKISAIIKKEMDTIGGQEIFMPALVEKKYLDATGRWDVEIGYEVKGKNEKSHTFSLGWTHEEVITEIAKRFVNSYKDLPLSVYQIQTKFRNEPRAKSGLLRGREFLMKDLYSFHASEEDLNDYYEKTRKAYHNIFNKCGLDAVYTLAGGGAFTAQNTHEFQVVSPVGEDTVLICSKCNYAENKEISKLKKGGSCPQCNGGIEEKKSIEVGNIFPLGTKYSDAFDLKYLDKEGRKKEVVMGSYGIGLGRLMGAVVELRNDEGGIIWPESLAPFKFYLISLDGKEKEAKELYEKLRHNGAEVLYDDRNEKSAGEKFADADLLGIPVRIVVSAKTLEKGSAEIKRRNEQETKLVNLAQVSDLL